MRPPAPGLGLSDTRSGARTKLARFAATAADVEMTSVRRPRLGTVTARNMSKRVLHKLLFFLSGCILVASLVLLRFLHSWELVAEDFHRVHRWMPVAFV